MAFLATFNTTETSISFYVADLNMTTTYSEIYVSCNGQRSPNLAKSTISQTSERWTLYGLQCGDSYVASWYIRSSGGSEADGSSVVWTADCPVDVSVGPISWFAHYPDMNGRDVSFSWGDAANATSYFFELYLNGSIVQRYSVPGKSTSVQNLSYGNYSAYVRGERFGVNDGPASNLTFSFSPPVDLTPGQPGTVSLSPSTSTPGRLYASWGSASGASDYLVTIYTGAGGYVDSVTVAGTSVTFNGLTEGRSYYVAVVPRNSHGSGPSSTSLTITMPSINVRPSNWQWDNAKTAGSALNITANEWNRFLNRIDAFRAYKGYSAGSYTYASTGSDITANQYNQARSAIATMGAVPPAVSRGATIRASEFNSIRDYLNTIN